ncbi:MAG TPA: glycosyltransferase family 4 protein [Thermoanaerobaculia bacterium]|jgi:glycosyltransferase involved in cell wall biosynthesis|nr:glycosyltransferase family 4 protein [Thermoanaerobaculia bacterium]
MVTYGPLSAEMGASQVALNLADALSARGHQVVVWSPQPLPPRVRWWQDWIWRRRQLEDYLAAAPAFDVVDLPSIAISSRIARHAPLVARSTQPVLQYFLLDVRDALARAGRTPLIAAAQLLHTARLSTAVMRGWYHASLILCLGTAEREWMHRRLPWTRPRLAHYFNAVGREEQEELSRLRRQRSGPPGPGLRFLWIGRWTRHKGTDRLLRFLVERAAARPEDSFTLAGTGAAASESLPAGLRDRIRIVPSFSRSELPGLLASHDAGLFTSVSEGWGLSLNEMLESGMPVFATEAGGVRDLKPYFPATLRPFTPPLDNGLPAGRDTDLGSYYQHFTWEAIAERYEGDVLHRLQKATA